MSFAWDDAPTREKHWPTVNELVERAIRSARPRDPVPLPRWAAVSETFACGSTVAQHLCTAAGLDPDEDLPGIACVHCEERAADEAAEEILEP